MCSYGAVLSFFFWISDDDFKTRESYVDNFTLLNAFLLIPRCYHDKKNFIIQLALFLAMAISWVFEGFSVLCP
jgi:hypothetical protein